jgi:hypothetical protein
MPSNGSGLRETLRDSRRQARAGALQILYAASHKLSRIFMRRRSIIAINDMSTSFLRTRQISLALLVTAVVEHRQTPGSSDECNPHSSRLLRLGHELMHTARLKQLSRLR